MTAHITETKPKVSSGTGDAWPNLVHLARRPVKEGGFAICGAKIMGIELPNATKVCKKCTEIAKRVSS